MSRATKNDYCHSDAAEQYRTETACHGVAVGDGISDKEKNTGPNNAEGGERS